METNRSSSSVDWLSGGGDNDVGLGIDWIMEEGDGGDDKIRRKRAVRSCDGGHTIVVICL